MASPARPKSEDGMVGVVIGGPAGTEDGAFPLNQARREASA
jgi:hypothetical protein